MSPEEGFKLWYYTPSLALAIVATITFAILTLYHTYRLSTTRLWFCIPFIVGGLMETIGYAARAAATRSVTSLTPYIIQSLLLLISPALFAASIYMVLGRLMRATHAQHHSFIRVNWLTKIFVCADIFCFLVQGGGGGLQAQSSSFKTGQTVVLAGLVLQIVTFGFFLVAAGIWHHRLRVNPTKESLTGTVPWQRMMWILYAVSLLIATRNVIRVVEYALGRNGYFMDHEWTLYVFDALLMAITLLVSVTWYSIDLRSGSDSEICDVEVVEAKDRMWNKSDC